MLVGVTSRAQTARPGGRPARTRAGGNGGSVAPPRGAAAGTPPDDAAAGRRPGAAVSRRTSPRGPHVEAAFYFDLCSPHAYLAAERALAVLPAPCEWQPISSRLLPAAASFEAYRCEHALEAMRENVERRAAALALAPVRWPVPFPFDSDIAMLAATFAKRIGKTVAFALAAFRQAYAGGHALSQPANVLIAGAACEMHPAAILQATRTRGLRTELERASSLALALGVIDVPAVRVGERVLVGEAALEEAGVLLAQARA